MEFLTQNLSRCQYNDKHPYRARPGGKKACNILCTRILENQNILAVGISKSLLYAFIKHVQLSRMLQYRDLVWLELANCFAISLVNYCSNLIFKISHLDMKLCGSLSEKVQEPPESQTPAFTLCKTLKINTNTMK